MAGEGVQVVDVRDGRYQLNEEGLTSILMQDAVRDLPVVVVSVAGAFRGGKSFILDFFLRYLNAPDACRKNGEWLGKEDEPLLGFSWRSGTERNTIGIHLWSQPAILRLPTGEQVAVLLMDTQGTFDCESTMKDCTTIFALSTLISSVQIYNIHQNMKEDDLQHLELFTEYAQLVLNEVGKPFQNLTFLIRDWMFPADYPFGSKGGKQLLNKKLQISKEQPEELQKIRRHIRSCFEEIDCFLMAHPGFAVCDPTFKGRLADLRPEFKENLMELVPLIFAPNNLTPKAVNCCRVTCGDLALYFRTFLDMFNSGELPTPATILQATAEAGLMLAAEAARAQYAESMASGGAGASEGRAMPHAALYRLHAGAIAAARQHFNSKKILADRHRTDEILAQLMEEFSRRLKEFEVLNETKLRNARDEAKNIYVKNLLLGSKEHKLCVNSIYLEKLHRDAVKVTNEYFDQHRVLIEDSEDKERPLLMLDLNERYQQFVSTNELNNKMAVNEALTAFDGMVEKEARNPCMSATDLKAFIDRVRADAIQHFNRKRTHMSNESDDKHLSDFNKDLNERWVKMTAINELNNNNAITDALEKYVQAVEMATNCGNACMSTMKLKAVSEEARAAALSAFKNKRTNRSYSADESFIVDLLKNIEERYTGIEQMNSNNNKANQEAVVAYYKDQMSKIFGTHMQCLSLKDFEDEEARIRRDAISLFHNKRKFGASDDNNDKYKENIMTELRSNYQEFYDSNEGMNSEAVESAHAEYNRLMDATTRAKTAILATLSLVLLPFRILQLLADLRTLHENAERAAITVFTNRRRGGKISSPDTYYDDLKRHFAVHVITEEVSNIVKEKRRLLQTMENRRGRIIRHLMRHDDFLLNITEGKIEKISQSYNQYANPFVVVARDLGSV